MSDKKIAVLQIIKSLGRGGAEMLLIETLKLHNKRDFDFHYIYFLPWKNQLVEDLLKEHVKVTCFPSNNNLKLMFRTRAVARYVKENDIKLIHAHLPWAGVLARMVGKITGVPVIYTEHNKQERYHFLTRLLNLSTMNSLAMVIPVSNDVAQSIVRHKPKLLPPVNTVLNGVNVNSYTTDKQKRNEIRQKLSIPSASVVISTIAVFRVQKRLDIWLEIAKKILSYRPDTHFIIVGDGPLKQILVKKLQELDLTSRVHMVGLQTEVRPYLAATDVYMISSVFEGLPIALLEAMASGLPVITTAAGGIIEVVAHQKEGFVCRVDNPIELVQWAVTLIDDKLMREKLGANARQKVIKEFSIDKMVSRLETIYRSLTNVI